MNLYNNIKGQGHSLTLILGHSDSNCLNFFSLETAGPIEAKVPVEPPWIGGGGGAKVCSNGPGHMTKMAAMPIFGKNLKKYSSQADDLELGMQHCVLEYCQICSNEDPGFILTYFKARLNLVPYAPVWERGQAMLLFSETIVIYDMSYVMRKHVYAVCEQQRRRSACTSAQSDQHLCCSLPG